MHHVRFAFFGHVQLYRGFHTVTFRGNPARHVFCWILVWSTSQPPDVDTASLGGCLVGAYRDLCRV